MEQREPSLSRERLAVLLDLMRRKAPSRAPEPLSRLDAVIQDGKGEELASLLPLLKERCPEEAVERLRRPGGLRTEAMLSLLKALEPSASQARARRAARIGWDASRARLRMRLARNAPLLDLDTQDLQILLHEALHLEGLQPALDLGRHPKPLIALAPPLSVGVEGREEVVEAECRVPMVAPWMDSLNARLPEGLCITEAMELPTWASSAAELAERAEYLWPCPLPPAQARPAWQRFLEASSFMLEKPGKQGGQKGDKKVELRPEVLRGEWHDEALRFEMPLRLGKALSPLKLLGAIFSVEPSTLQGLVRLRVHLKEDPRLQQGERFETKLKNIYEDATLLTSGGNITLVDEEDDEPLKLG